MYRWLRDFHLGVGLFSAIFLLVFGVSAIQMAYPIPEPRATETTTTIDVPATIRAHPRAVAQWLMDEQGLRGELTEVRTTSTGVSLTIARTGTTRRVEYESQHGPAQVKTQVLSSIGMVKQIHLSFGTHHGYWGINAWGWLLLIVSLALLVLAGTGVVMWFKRHEDRRLGSVIAGVSLTWGLTLLILMRTM